MRPVLVLLAALLAPLPACAERAPDLVLVSFDTLRADRVGAFGGPAGLTPNLDRFAAEAVTFERAYAQGTFTAPSHGSVFTSRYPPEILRFGRHPELGAGTPTLAEVLAVHGYDTAAFVAGGDLAREIGLDRGFGTYASPQDFGSFFHTVRPAIAWLDARTSDAPFFLFLHSYDTHSPYLRAPPFGPPRPAPADEGPAGQALRTSLLRLVDGWFVHDIGPFLDLTNARLRPRSPSVRAELAALYQAYEPAPVAVAESDLEEVRAAYDGAVSYADVWFGLLMAELDRAGVLDHAVVAVISDHGEGLGEDGLFNHCCQMDDATTRVPLMVRMPGGAHGGARIAGLVELTDLMPTFLELGAATAPAGARGRSFAPALRGEAFEGRPHAFTIGTEGMRMTSARTATGRFTYVGVPPWTDGAADLVAASALPGPSFVASGMDAAEQAHARDAIVGLLRSLRPLPARADVATSPALKDALRKHGYWDVGP